MQFQHIRRLRTFVYNILQNDEHDTLFSRYVDYFLIFLIMTNVAAVIAESVDSWYYPYQDYFTWFENFSIVVFSIEYLLRLWSVAEAKPDHTTWRQRWQWLKSPSALIDLVAIVPAFLNFFVTIDLRFLRILRLFRILKLTRYFASMRILLVVISKEKGSFQAVIFILIDQLVGARQLAMLSAVKVTESNIDAYSDNAVMNDNDKARFKDTLTNITTLVSTAD